MGHRRCLPLLLLTVLALVIAPPALSQPAALVPQEAHDEPTAARDFGDAITLEAVDLSAATNLEGDGEALQSLLHWAISHSDTDVLRQQAEDAATDQAVEEVVRTMAERKERVQELHKYMSQQPTEIDVMKEAIAMLSNATADEEEQLGALEALQMLVEPIDNANDLKVLGGIPQVVQRLTAEAGPRLNERAAHVVGTAASNNPQFQRDLLEEAPGVLADLLRISGSSDAAAAAKGLYAVGNLVRNTDAAVAAFVAAGGVRALGNLLSSRTGLVRLKLRALNIMMDISTGDRRQGPVMQAMLQQGGVVAGIVQLLGSSEAGAAEPTLLAAQALLRDSHDARALLLDGGAGHAAAQLVAAQQHAPAADAEDDDEGAAQYRAYLVKLANEVAKSLAQGAGGSVGGRTGEKTEL